MKLLEIMTVNQQRLKIGIAKIFCLSFSHSSSNSSSSTALEAVTEMFGVSK